MKLRDVHAVGLGLRAYAPALRLLATIVEQVLYLDPKETVLATDVFRRVVTYLRTIANDVAAAQHGIPVFSVAKKLVDAVDQFEEALSLGSAKACKDLASALDSIACDLERPISDIQSVSDTRSSKASKVLADATPANESSSIEFGRPLKDLPFTQDSFSAAWDYIRQALDVVILGDASTLSFSKAQTDLVSTAESNKLNVSHRLSDLTSTSLDLLSVFFRKPFAESAGTSDATFLASGFTKLLTEGGDYVDPTYGDYFYFDHSPLALDTTAIRFAKSFLDGGAVSDTASRVVTQFRTFTDTAIYVEGLAFDNRKIFTDSKSATDSAGKYISMYLLEGGLYADLNYFVSSDYVSGGLAVGESLTHSP